MPSIPRPTRRASRWLCERMRRAITCCGCACDSGCVVRGAAGRSRCGARRRSRSRAPEAPLSTRIRCGCGGRRGSSRHALDRMRKTMAFQRMPTRQRIVTYGFTTAAAATITVALLLQPWRGDRVTIIHEPTPPPPAPTKHPVDVVFAVDTTGSMGGLIEGAKRTVWSIATHIQKTDTDADVRIGLVAYRDIGDDYVTRDFALTGDLDSVFTELSSYRAAGGGDTPEDVAAALYDALNKMQWRGDARKLVFLVGDAPPASRGDVPRFDVLAREAGERQIVINTIRCGLDGDTQLAWQQIASLGHGQFSTIQQDGG